MSAIPNAIHKLAHNFWMTMRDGGVVVLLHWEHGEPTLSNFAHFGQPVIRDHWASAVCATSDAGELGGRWHQLMHFLEADVLTATDEGEQFLRQMVVAPAACQECGVEIPGGNELCQDCAAKVEEEKAAEVEKARLAEEQAKANEAAMIEREHQEAEADAELAEERKRQAAGQLGQETPTAYTDEVQP